MAHYFNAYAVHFNLLPYIRFGVIIRKISRNASDSGWIIRYQEQGSDDENAVEVSKVVLAHGQHTTPNIPKIAGIELFKGTIAHSRAFKRCIKLLQLMFHALIRDNSNSTDRNPTKTKMW
jgi:cation diffusion facilitator CzcD-associated flavoprotein CzcO